MNRAHARDACCCAHSLEVCLGGGSPPAPISLFSAPFEKRPLSRRPRFFFFHSCLSLVDEDFFLAHRARWLRACSTTTPRTYFFIQPSADVSGETETTQNVSVEKEDSLGSGGGTREVHNGAMNRRERRVGVCARPPSPPLKLPGCA